MFKKDLKQKEEKEKEINWFDDHDVLYIDSTNQREVILNPGRDFEWFNKVYPVIGKVAFTRKVYIKDLPPNCLGKIIAVTAVPKDKDKVKELRYKIPYKDLSTRGLLKAKPLGTYYELFEGGGYREWTNPTEYQHVDDNRPNRRQNKRVSEDTTRSGAKLEQVAGFTKQFRPANTNSSKNNTTPRVERKS